MDEQEVSSSSLMNTTDKKDRLRVKKKTLQMVLEQCQRALESLDDSDDVAGIDSDDDDAGECCDGEGESSGSNREADELCDLLKSRVECPDFLDKLGSASPSIPEHISDEGGSWDMVSKNDLWEDGDENAQDDFVLVSQEDIVDGIAGFMAAYLLSLKQTKDLSPNKLQEALSKTFSVKKKKGKLRKAWDGSKVIYNVASWGATAIGIYQNPALLKVASDAFWASCQVISKLL